MEMTMNTGAFEALDQKEMMEVDGGLDPITWMRIGFGIDGAIEALTGKSAGGWVSYSIKKEHSIVDFYYY